MTTEDTRSIPNLQLNFLAIHIDRPDLEIYAYCRDKRGCKLVFAKSKKKT
jgi:hypothetical protein